MGRGFGGTDRFKLLGEVGSGGMGVVYRAFDEELGHEVALKTARRPDPGDLYRLKQEFRSRAGIVHPNLLQLHDLVVDDSGCFFTMELLDARDFLTWVRGSGATDPSSMERTITIVPDHESGNREEISVEMLVRPPLDPEGQGRLRRGLRQLLPALAALHRAGFIHRDVKPGNVLVAQTDQRVVLADFGLATPMPELPGEDSFEGFPVGSVPYMAPEQATGDGPTPAADLYAVGVMIYEALAGKPPFYGPALRVLHQKATKDAKPLQAVAMGMPEGLADLAMDLLRRNPSERPTVEEALACLGGPESGSDPDSSDTLTSTMTLGLGTMSSMSPLAPFVGRSAELSLLSSAFARVDAGLWTTVHTHGPSGIGKSTLLRRFTRDLERQKSALVLRGRCHPQESLPFKALDAVVDSLSHHLGRLTEQEQRSVAPRYCPALRRLFPVLGRVDGLRYAGGAPAGPRSHQTPGRSGARASPGCATCSPGCPIASPS